MLLQEFEPSEDLRPHLRGQAVDKLLDGLPWRPRRYRSLDGGARGVVAVAQYVGDGLAHGLPGDLRDLAALHTGLAEHERAPDVGHDDVVMAECRAVLPS